MQTALTGAGYALYDPFGLIPHRTYNQTVRLFVAPPARSWVRILADAPIPIFLMEALSQITPCLSVELTTDAAVFTVFADGTPTDTVAALTPHLREGLTPDVLENALNHAPEITVIDPDDKPNTLPLDALGDDIRGLNDKIDPKMAGKMFNKVVSGLFGKSGGNVDAAQNFLSGAQPFDWNTPAGWQAQAVMDVLTIGDGWHQPGFIAVRDAYALHLRRQQTPKARLHPGDAEAMAAVPDALTYVPVYAGRNT